jgi:hypothetical protein
MDAIAEAEWQLSEYRLSFAETGRPKNFEAWRDEWLKASTRSDVVRVQMDAELSNPRLVPHTGRYRSVLEKGVKLKTRPRAVLCSRYPLDEISECSPPVLGWPYGYGRDLGTVAGPIEAERRSRPYHIVPGARLIYAHPVEVKTLDYFDTQAGRTAKSYIAGAGKKYGVDALALECVVAEGLLECPKIPRRKPAQRQRATRKRRKPGFLHYVGTGPALEIESGAANAIKSARTLWIQDLGQPGLERTSIRPLLAGKQIINTVFFYGSGHLRSFNRDTVYTLMTRRAIDLVNKGRDLTVVFSGSPAIWVRSFELARQYAETHPDFDLRLTNAMSFLETLFPPTPLGQIGAGVQLRLASITNPDVSPEIDCIVGQVGDTGQPYGIGTKAESLEQALARLYPPNHPIYVVGNDEIDSTPLYIETTADQVGAVAHEFARCYFCLVIPSLSRAKVVRNLGPIERSRQELEYLRLL